MKLNLKEYTDPNEVAFHANAYLNCWRYMQYLDAKDEQLVSIEIADWGEEHRDWLVENVPWLVKHLDREIIDFLRPADVMLHG